MDAHVLRKSVLYWSSSGGELVRPRVPLEACLSSFSAPEEVHDFHSTALNAKTTAIKYVYSRYFSCFFYHEEPLFIRRGIIYIFLTGQQGWPHSLITWFCTCGSLLWRLVGSPRSSVLLYYLTKVNNPCVLVWQPLLGNGGLKDKARRMNPRTVEGYQHLE